MRYRLIKTEWMKQDPSLQNQPNVIEADDLDLQFLQDKNNLGYNVYYFPNRNSKPIDKPFLSGKDVDLFSYVFVDMDLKDGIYKTPEEFIDLLMSETAKPNKIVLSGNGVHAYWEVSDLTLESYIEIQLQLIKKFKTDTSIWTVLQLMRLPGLYNTKDPHNPKFVEELQVHNSKFIVNDLKLVLPELNAEDRHKMEIHINKVKGLAEFADFDESNVEIPEKFIKLLENNRLVQDLWSAEVGKRSEADYKIAKMLFDLDYSRDETLAVILNGNKALEKGVHGKSYAITVVGTAFLNKAKNYVPSAAQMVKSGILSNKRGRLVKGPSYLDCNHNRWRTGQLFGLIGSPGVGKSSVSLDMFYEMIKNNPQDEEIFIFFSLEMASHEVVEKWQALTWNEPHLSERLYVVSNEDQDGNSKYINLQDVYHYTKDISKVSGQKVKAICIDHGGLLNPSVDVTRKPTFGLDKRDELGYGNVKTMSERDKPQFIKSLAKELDVFCILQSQTSKERAGEGDIPLGLGAAYGVSQYEQSMDLILTIWQPLRRIRFKSDLTCTAFQICKNRNQHKLDKVRPFDARVLHIDLDTGKLRNLTNGEYSEFLELNAEATQLRKMAEKHEGIHYNHDGVYESDTLQNNIEDISNESQS